MPERMLKRRGRRSEQYRHLFDPLAYAGTFIGVSIACAVSASLPALRAARIDPIATLRED
jgi:ABC-type antimicrobial peptide transport system permease subunit